MICIIKMGTAKCKLSRLLGHMFGRWPAGKYPNKGSRFDGGSDYIVVPRCAIHSSVGGRVP